MPARRPPGPCPPGPQQIGGACPHGGPQRRHGLARSRLPAALRFPAYGVGEPDQAERGADRGRAVRLGRQPATQCGIGHRLQRPAGRGGILLQRPCLWRDALQRRLAGVDQRM